MSVAVTICGLVVTVLGMFMSDFTQDRVMTGIILAAGIALVALGLMF